MSEKYWTVTIRVEGEDFDRVYGHVPSRSAEGASAIGQARIYDLLGKLVVMRITVARSA